MSQKRRKNSIDRATRLIVTLTIASGTAIIVKGAFSAWFKTFSTTAYIQNFLNFDYMFSVLFLTVTILCAFSIGRYLFFELKTFIYYENISEQQLAYEASDNAYLNIFKTIKNCFNVVFAFLAVTTLPKVFENNYSWKYILIGILIIGISILGLFFINKEKLKKAVKFTARIESKIGIYLPFVYVAFIIFISGLTITILSLNSNQTARILIEDSNNVPVEIELKNNLNSKVFLKIKNSEEEFFISDSELTISESYVEVLEKSEELKSNDIEHFVKNLSEENDRMNIPKSEYSQVYSVDLGDYIVSGINNIEITIVSTGSNNTKAIHFYTTVNKEGNSIEITKKKMNLEL
ncbi:hypothetical protein A8F94_00435 [Bacillus sp. FJAT-27225]|uniref:hypothetical protein n=1 Tax=Bacillus sp. FJAT-27225 TaxID=1743144 RepID=UPI00080C31B1|nr:hypothetical protein [Bacillus sp. FJAT-27225]OCA90399.1 hypothetical protein A8F94_00435 [Bacillus sp. FJAT-27225]